MIQRLFEALLRPVFDLVAHLMSQLFLAPFRALFGAEDREPEDEPSPNDEGADEPKRLPAPDGPKPESPESDSRD